jgi:hypothetical protein
MALNGLYLNAEIKVDGDTIRIAFVDGSGMCLSVRRHETEWKSKVACSTSHHNRNFLIGNDVSALMIVEVLKDIAS